MPGISERSYISDHFRIAAITVATVECGMDDPWKKAKPSGGDHWLYNDTQMWTWEKSGSQW